MFIYIGNNELIKTESIIAIIDSELSEYSEYNERLISEHRKVGKIFGSKDDAKSIIITKEEIYYSPLATLTLKNRDALYEEMNKNYGVKFKFVNVDK
ncbi:MAG TPA: extracellular matrix/biofilm biosynthesis regulator RemA family protein [Pseudogracilibacillus sp.]|nr:extracellular matrix/biofilm biosynthesis regulator RemA family protein [Pseudogracilibacillus sp.]